MNKIKTPRRSRLIRKWDGTQVVDADLTERPGVSGKVSTTPSELDSKPKQAIVTHDAELEDELTDTVDR